MPYQDVLVGDLLGAIEEHSIEPFIHSGIGQSTCYLDEVRAFKVIIDDVVKEALEVPDLYCTFLK